jgi:hypothetical protein
VPVMVAPTAGTVHAVSGLQPLPGTYARHSASALRDCGLIADYVHPRRAPPPVRRRQERPVGDVGVVGPAAGAWTWVIGHLLTPDERTQRACDVRRHRVPRLLGGRGWSSGFP